MARVDQHIPCLRACWSEGAHADFVLMICTRGYNKNAQPEDTGPHVPFLKVTSQKSHFSLGDKAIWSREQNPATWKLGGRRMENAQLCPWIPVLLCLQVEVRHFFLMDSGGFFLHTTSIYLSSEAIGIGLSYLVTLICIFSFTFSMGGGIGCSLYCSILENFFSSAF